MRFSWRTPICLLVLLLGLTGLSNAALVSVFNDGAFVDNSGGTGSEATNIIAAVGLLGHTANPFTGITAPDWIAAGLGADAILIPELEGGDLAGALSPAAIAAIAGYVSSGGGLIISGSEFTSGSPRSGDFLNTVFGFSVTEGSESTASSSALTGAEAGTAFAGGPSPVQNFSGTSSLTGLPVGALSIYEETIGGASTVAWMPFGSGQIVYLGFDWFNAAPIGTVDGGWNEILDRAITQVGTAAIPVPGTFVLLGLGLVGIAARRRQ